MSDELNEVKVDIALIKKDIKQIERFFNKVDHAVDDMSDIAKNLAVQQAIIKNFEEKFNHLNEKLEDHRRGNVEGRLAIKEELDDYKEQFKEEMMIAMEEGKKQHALLAEETRKWNEARQKEVIAIIENIGKNVDEKLDEQDERIRSLENVKWYAMGIFAVIVFILSMIDLPSLFG